MRLKSIEIFGFKSFGKKMIIDFSSPVTAIVGPNGSGKSNIVDAVRWVLGEQRTKSLRAGKMEDIIFSGTENKRALGYAQVSIILDNSDGMFRIDYDEIAITRRLFRSGESEYLINKTKCRLRDIQELLMDTGLSREGYSIIGQGQIESIVNNSPQERKLLIEEAVGIVKYKSGKIEAEKQLEKAAANLYRITDIIAEIESRLPNLKKQAQKAETFRELSTQLRDIEVAIFVSRTDMLNESLKSENVAKAAIEESLNEISRQIEENEAKKEALRADISSREDELLILSAALADAESEYESVSKDLSDAKNEKTVNEGKIQVISAEVEYLNKSARELSEKRDSLEESLAKFRDEEAVLSAIYEEKRSISEKLRAEHEDAENNIRELNIKLDEENKKLLSLREEEAKMRLRGENAALSREEYKTNLSEKEIQAENERKLLAENVYASILSALEESMKEQKASVDDITAKGESLRDDISETFTAMQTKQARLNLLRGFDESLQGYKNAVKKIDELKKNDEYFAKGIRGILGEVVRYEPKYAEAVSKALGGAIEYIITSDEKVASRAIELLKRNKWGRLTFMPRNIVTSSKFNMSEDVKKMPGYIGLAVELVECDDEFRQITDNVLYRTVIADNLDNANKIAARLSHRNKIVTLDGDVILSGGAMVGGKSKNEDSGVLSRKAEIQILEEEITVLKDKYDKLLSERSLCAEEYKKAKAGYDDCQGEYLSVREKYTEFELSQKSIKDKIREIDSDISSLNIKITEMTSLEELCNIQLSEFAEMVEASLRYIDELSSQKEDTDNSARDAVFAAINEANEAGAALSNKTQSINFVLESIRDTEEGITKNKSEVLAKEKLISETVSGSAHLDSIIDEYTFKTVSADEKRTSLKNSERSLREEISSMKDEDSSVGEVITSLFADKSVVVEKLGKVQNEVNKISLQIDNLAANMLEDYEITYSLAKEMNPVISKADLGEALQNVGSLKERIKKLGNINADAIEEYANERSRFEDMCIQRDDLIKSSEELRGIISDISENMLIQFKREFAVIQKEFNNVFRELFNGGEARLVLTDPEDILNSGVDIIAQPPKTKLKNISSLSGGEKTMTAISLIFAILRIKPSPFTVLDEIDAALDEANVLRFCEYLESIKKDNQFVIITHKKKTMENCDVLYGATMNSDGITKILSVKLTDINEKGELV